MDAKYKEFTVLENHSITNQMANTTIACHGSAQVRDIHVYNMRGLRILSFDTPASISPLRLYGDCSFLTDAHGQQGFIPLQHTRTQQSEKSLGSLDVFEQGAV